MSDVITRQRLGTVELRQYTLHPGRFDSLVELFEREFIETQEAVGMRVIGQFRDLDDPDRFVWLRGFADMPARAEALQAFYDGPVWRAHRDAANAHFVDTDDVLLLRPTARDDGFDVDPATRPAPGAETPGGLVVVTIYTPEEPLDEFATFFHQVLRPLLTSVGMPTVVALETEAAANNFPRLPVREGDDVFVWMAAFARAEEYHAGYARLRESREWRDALAPSLRRRLKATPQVLRLQPTPRSLLRG